MQESIIIKELKLKNTPISILVTDETPENALAFDSSITKGACSLAAIKEVLQGKTVYFSGASRGCPGLKSGFGFQDETKIPGGIEYFLSCGRGEGYPEGEKLKKTPEIAKQYFDSLPKQVMDAKYIVLKPLEPLKGDRPKLVVFLANPDQLSALITLFSYESSILDNVIAPMTSGCSSLIRLPLDELRKENPRAIIGLIDIWARPILGADIFALTVPYEAYLKMEENAKDCFLQTKTWDGIKNRLE